MKWILKHKIVILKFVVSLFFIGFIGYKIDFQVAFNSLGQINIGILSIPIFIFALRNYLAAWRLKIILSITSFKTEINDLTKDYFISFFLNLFLPTSVGGDVSRGFYLTNYGVDKKNAVSAIVLERFLGLSVIFLFPSFLLLTFGNYPQELAPYCEFILATSALMILSTILLFTGATPYLLEVISRILPVKISELTSKTYNTIKPYGISKGQLTKAFILSFLFQGAGIYATHLIINSVIDLPFIVSSIIICILLVVTILPISVGGFGVREGTFIYLMSLVNVPEETSLLISILMVMHLLIQGCFGAILYLSK